MAILKGFMAGQENNAFFTFNEANDMLTKMFASPKKVAVEDAADVAENELNEIVDDPYVRPQAKMSPEEMVFFAKNSKREGVMTTMSSKIQYELVLGNGRGASPIFSDRVSVFYFAKYEKDGEIINVEKESFLNIDYQEDDWQEIFQLLKVGNTYRFYLPSVYASNAPEVFANSGEMIIVDIELAEIR